ncbi:MAG: hypothetical protein JGK24_27890 [Microcoleus sp. PH2017_29_MFU_D_A]|uniref:hypothetical protein n=1 Tax=unclassified Microcoleus TaxID=2642155 RepID=UPI001DE7A597|nr:MULTISPECIES: hypothetical protein [unclassified Microcoleus]MCC3416210.1 hypothetical protein [Microcoleus sp. PH2017_02_FOX_O_A]MCC3494975.1 hypothetical protein [Microcoleus sp. PH2017_16_JOR_D_A]MCC3519959.1 hypothetical protein [Microcoleus sp. PH2017_18_LLB_O_A]MCC3526395.1 hypothetical protein [Microcoleus sp. PH2017_20_SFW_D_A]MCC3538691.1 hypothetical protein [Microcoleus sp. PH2017_25_DOB_D_A]
MQTKKPRQKLKLKRGKMKNVRSFSSISNTAKYIRSAAVMLTQIGCLPGILMTPAVTPNEKKLNLCQQRQ